ncbi:exodeoxyribonuclease V subunit gamma [Alteromonas sp. ASW11-130]|uniref:exodeoxyribonuclease V subunit gamma n=1 Tax=Alteromonas sp. ASW11-130 TaxID=3015775 RepID=UPI0022426798|nr:exodeoxyribonuclease V subunit gamma [Alteromonas sp. ASW11-130]MCW8090260.1 exodeoxyribonuclease V subunit gamma [Alteromonas sp. ASW11-130]
MLALYPSNKLEHLSFLLSALLKEQPGTVFSTHPILVESPGMQHWLSMQLAHAHGIAMNLQFPLPVRFMWDTARDILGENNVPRQSIYRRETLVWRIDEILLSDVFCQHLHAKRVCEYWQNQSSDDERSSLRLQFATAIADVFEQYLLYRPDWLEKWESREQCLSDNSDEKWQAIIWQMLTDEEPLHPARLHQLTLDALKQGSYSNLPQHVIVFAINTMAPQLVHFLDALAQHTTVHIFHLNPSINYWGEGVSDRQLARKLREQGIQAFANDEQANSLLNNLGKQGRDLFNLLTPLQSFEVSGFDVAADEQQPDFGSSLLSTIQQDILHASAPQQKLKLAPTDNSIIVSSAHSPLREVQALHDQLLSLIQNDPTVRPSDIVVMCPAVEQYAPLVGTVFNAPGSAAQDATDTVKLPCSIADRAPLDAEPLIAAFLELLHLPDSRFGVNQIMAYLRLESVQVKFKISNEALELITHWLQKAHVHWGLDARQQAGVLGQNKADDTYSWKWGFDRLLKGMLAEDTSLIVDGVVTVPDVEGQNTLVLGQLILIINQLKKFAEELKESRSPAEWNTFLITLRNTCFAPLPAHEYAWEQINLAAAAIEDHCNEASYTQKITLSQLRELLTKRFSRPDTGSQFHTGQVTFCSMLPMRSIPFKVVCILGLNDGDFPRQSQPISVDLMAFEPARLGDRSRRQEDRYLFLEAILSARDHLYLSYQGRHSHDNSERQPSLVLAELLSFINQGYLEPNTPFPVRQQPLHPYSNGNFTPTPTSFDAGWMRLAREVQKKEEGIHPAYLKLNAEAIKTITVGQLARCLAHPLKFFANEQLSIYLELDNKVLDDVEPFAANALTRYQSMFELGEAIREQRDIAAVEQFIELSGNVPSTPLTPVLMNNWKTGAQLLFESIGFADGAEKKVERQIEGVQLTATVWEESTRLVAYHYGAQSVQRIIEHTLTARLCNAAHIHKPLELYSLRWNGGEASVYKSVINPEESTNAEAHITPSILLMQRAAQMPFPAFAGLSQELLKKLPQEQSLKDWCDSFEAKTILANQINGQGMISGLNQDPYVRLFYPLGLNQGVLPLTEMENTFSVLALDLKSKKV